MALKKWFEKQVQEVLAQCHELSFDEDKQRFIGDFDITNPKTNDILESFEIEIRFPKGYPQNRLPVVKEISHKLPRNHDRHVYEDGELCLTSPLNEFLICKKSITLLQFLNDILKPFLACQIAISAGWIDEFPQGEYGHGFIGIEQTYSDHFKVKELSRIINGLKISLDTNQRNKLCYCGSNKKLKKCHILQVEELKTFDSNSRKADLAKLELLNGLNLYKKKYATV